MKEIGLLKLSTSQVYEPQLSSQSAGMVVWIITTLPCVKVCKSLV